MDGDYSVVDDFSELKAELKSTESMLKVDKTRLRNAIKMETFLREELRQKIEETTEAPSKELYGTSQLHAYLEDVLDSAILLRDLKPDIPEVCEVKKFAMDIAFQLIEEFIGLKFANPVPQKLTEKALKFLENYK